MKTVENKIRSILLHRNNIIVIFCITLIIFIPLIKRDYVKSLMLAVLFFIAIIIDLIYVIFFTYNEIEFSKDILHLKRGVKSTTLNYLEIKKISDRKTTVIIKCNNGKYVLIKEKKNYNDEIISKIIKKEILDKSGITL